MIGSRYFWGWNDELDAGLAGVVLRVRGLYI